MHMGLKLVGAFLLVIALTGWTMLASREKDKMSEVVPVGTSVVEKGSEKEHEGMPHPQKEDMSMEMKEMESAIVPEKDSMKTVSPAPVPTPTQQTSAVSPPPPATSVMEARQAGAYEVYAPEKLSRADFGDVVLFFRASWCPSCKALDTNIRANQGSIPNGVTILDVNYDDSSAMKQKYGVTYQHTLVQVDKGGTLIKKWSGSGTLEALLAEIQ